MSDNALIKSMAFSSTGLFVTTHSLYRSVFKSVCYHALQQTETVMSNKVVTQTFSKRLVYISWPKSADKVKKVNTLDT